MYKTIKKTMITTTTHKISIRKKQRYSDPRELQIDLDADCVSTDNHPDISIHGGRVMPMVDYEKFCKILSQKTKTFKEIDSSHFWVSGYYALYFYVKCKKDGLKIKKLVAEAIIESGGFMSFDDWYVEHNKKHTRIIQFNGTGRGICKTYDSGRTRIAFL